MGLPSPALALRQTGLEESPEKRQELAETLRHPAAGPSTEPAPSGVEGLRTGLEEFDKKNTVALRLPHPLPVKEVVLKNNREAMGLLRGLMKKLPAGKVSRLLTGTPERRLHPESFVFIRSRRGRIEFLKRGKEERRWRLLTLTGKDFLIGNDDLQLSWITVESDQVSTWEKFRRANLYAVSAQELLSSSLDHLAVAEEEVKETLAPFNPRGRVVQIDPKQALPFLEKIVPRGQKRLIRTPTLKRIPGDVEIMWDGRKVFLRNQRGRMEWKRYKMEEWEPLPLEGNLLVVTPKQFIYLVEIPPEVGDQRSPEQEAVLALQKRAPPVDAEGNPSGDRQGPASIKSTLVGKRPDLRPGGQLGMDGETWVIRSLIPDNERGGIKINAQSQGLLRGFHLQALVDRAEYFSPAPGGPMPRAFSGQVYRVDPKEGSRFEFVPGKREKVSSEAHVPAQPGDAWLVRIWKTDREPVDGRMYFFYVKDGNTLLATDYRFQLEDFREVKTPDLLDFLPHTIRLAIPAVRINQGWTWRDRQIQIPTTSSRPILVVWEKSRGELIFEYPSGSEYLVVSRLIPAAGLEEEEKGERLLLLVGDNQERIRQLEELVKTLRSDVKTMTSGANSPEVADALRKNPTAIFVVDFGDPENPLQLQSPAKEITFGRQLIAYPREPYDSSKIKQLLQAMIPIATGLEERDREEYLTHPLVSGGHAVRWRLLTGDVHTGTPRTYDALVKDVLPLDGFPELANGLSPLLSRFEEEAQRTEEPWVWWDAAGAIGVAVKEGRVLFPHLRGVVIDRIRWPADKLREVMPGWVFEAADQRKIQDLFSLEGIERFEFIQKDIAEVVVGDSSYPPPRIITVFQALGYSRDPLGTLVNLYNQLPTGGYLLANSYIPTEYPNAEELKSFYQGLFQELDAHGIRGGMKITDHRFQESPAQGVKRGPEEFQLGMVLVKGPGPLKLLLRPQKPESFFVQSGRDGLGVRYQVVQYEGDPSKAFEYPAAGLEEGGKVSPLVAPAVPSLKEIVATMSVVKTRSPKLAPQPLRFLADAKEKGDPRVLRLMELAVLLNLKKGYEIGVAGVATEEERDEAMAQLPEDAREPFEKRVFTYTPGDEVDYQFARSMAEGMIRRSGDFHPELVITTVEDPHFIGWFFEALELLMGRFTPELQRQIREYLTSA